MLKSFLLLNTQPRWVKRTFLLYLFVAVLAPLLANKEPLFMIQGKQWTFPAFQQKPYILLDVEGQKVSLNRASVDWKSVPASIKIFAPVPYDPSTSDPYNYNYISPFAPQWAQINPSTNKAEPLPWRFRHWLGTTKTGADVLSGLIYSTRLSLLIGFLTMLLASLIGILIGALAGFYGDHLLKVNKMSLLISLLLIVPAWYYIFQLPLKVDVLSTNIQDTNPPSFVWLKVLFFIFILCLPFLLHRNMAKYSFFKKQISIPLDTLISRFIELFLSVPRLILIITLAAISPASVWSIILILGFTSWTGIARLVRGEFIRLRHTGFSDATASLGFSPARKIFYHLLPNAFAPVRVVIVFGIATAILAEAGLSFLGIGLPTDTVSWGTLLAAGREQFSAWWLVVFPGIAISLLLMTLNKIGDERKTFQAEKLL